MTEAELLQGLLTKTLNWSQEEIDSLKESGEFTEDGTTKVFDAMAEKMNPTPINASKQELEDARKEGYSRAKKEVLGDLEKEVKAEFGLDTEAKGLALVVEAVNAKAGNADKHFKDKVGLLEKQLSDERSLRKETETKFTEYQTSVEKEKKELESFGAISSDAIRLLDNFNVVLPESEKAREVQKRGYAEKFRGITKEVVGTNEVVYKNGEMLKDRYNNPITFEQYAKGIASERFDIKKEENPPKPPTPGDPKPADPSEFNFVVESDEDYEKKRKKITEDESLSREEKVKAKVALSEARDKYLESQT